MALRSPTATSWKRGSDTTMQSNEGFIPFDFPEAPQFAALLPGANDKPEPQISFDGLDASYSMQTGSLYNDQVVFNPRHYSILKNNVQLDPTMRERPLQVRRAYFSKTFRALTGNYRIAQPEDKDMLALIEVCGDAIPIRWAIWKIVMHQGVQTAIPPAVFPPGGREAGWFSTHHLVVDLLKDYKRLLGKGAHILTVQRTMTKLVQFGTLEKYPNPNRKAIYRGFYRIKRDTEVLSQNETVGDLLAGGQTRCRPLRSARSRSKSTGRQRVRRPQAKPKPATILLPPPPAEQQDMMFPAALEPSNAQPPNKRKKT